MEQRIWRTKSSSEVDYIRAESLDAAAAEFLRRHGHKAVEFQPTDYRVFAVFFYGSCSPLYFKGTKKDALAGARLYIKQWQLDEAIESIQEI